MVTATVRCIAVGLLTVAAAFCASVPVRVPDKQYELTIKDVPSERLFRLELKALTDQAFCFDSESWPNSLGQPPADTQMILDWKGGQIRPKDGFEGYCPDGCRTSVPALGTLVGAVRYDVFGDAEVVASLDGRRLIVPIRPVPCR